MGAGVLLTLPCQFPLLRMTKLGWCLQHNSCQRSRWWMEKGWKNRMKKLFGTKNREKLKFGCKNYLALSWKCLFVTVLNISLVKLKVLVTLLSMKLKRFLTVIFLKNTPYNLFLLFSRQYRLERELKNRLWKIDYNLLGFERRTSNTSLASAIVSEQFQTCVQQLLKLCAWM